LTLKKKNTVKDIIDELNNSSIPYAILRNYKNFPNIKSDLDLISNIDVSKIKRILKKIRLKHKWDFLFYDDTKSKFFSNNNKIETFYFVDFKKLLFLQVDFFKSLSLISTPYYKILKRNSVNYFKKKIPIIPSKVTNTYHAFQIAKILRFKNFEKIRRYKSAFLSNKLIYKKNVIFENTIIKLLKINLKKNNFFTYKMLISIYKFLIFSKYYISNFIKIYLIFYRMFELILLYYFRPTGFNIKIFYKNKAELYSHEKYFNKLKKYNFINDWKYEYELSYFHKKFFLERRNILIKKKKTFSKKVSIHKIFQKSFINKFTKV